MSVQITISRYNNLSAYVLIFLCTNYHVHLDYHVSLDYLVNVSSLNPTFFQTTNKTKRPSLNYHVYLHQHVSLDYLSNIAFHFSYLLINKIPCQPRLACQSRLPCQDTRTCHIFSCTNYHVHLDYHVSLDYLINVLSLNPTFFKYYSVLITMSTQTFMSF